ncbi:PREDICTED: formin-like protein 5 [Ceratotherium simum simum]|uniref:Formin-like protein 5 n=1 Tax=Ceratotherium simum simum TaxID=73337 RepID=A0ABM1CJD8_CERSS|nr:PREDICTED: formin-like protein 5 [Ceratotherium simum simum]
MTPPPSSQTRGPPPPLAHPAPRGPTQCLRGVYSGPPEAALRSWPRRPPEAGGEGAALRAPARGRGSPANLTPLARRLARPPLSLRVPDSAAGTAARPPSPGRVRAGTVRPPVPPHPHEHGAARSPSGRLHALGGSVPSGLVATTARSRVPRPCAPRSWPQSCSGRCAPVARQRLLWARKRHGRGQLLAEKARASRDCAPSALRTRLPLAPPAHPTVASAAADQRTLAPACALRCPVTGMRKAAIGREGSAPSPRSSSSPPIYFLSRSLAHCSV